MELWELSTADWEILMKQRESWMTSLWMLLCIHGNIIMRHAGFMKIFRLCKQEGSVTKVYEGKIGQKFTECIFDYSN